jgi:HEAT repeat protein
MRAGTSRIDRLRSLQVAMLDVAFATAFGTLVGGSFLVGYVKHLDGSDTWVSLTATIPALMGLLQIPGALWGRRYPYFKRFITPGGWAWRLLHIILVFLPLVVMPNDIKLFLAMASIGVAAACVQLVSPIYADWIGELVPPSSRGWYFSRRHLISTVVGVLAGFAGSILLDAMRATGQEDLAFSIVFGLGWVCGIVSMIFFLRMKDTVRAKPVKTGLREGLRLMVKPAADKNFRRVLVFSFIFFFSQGFAGPQFTSYCLEVLGLTYTAIQIQSVSAAIATVLLVRFWGFLGDKYGSRPVLMLAVAGVSTLPIQWLLTAPGQFWYNAALLGAGHFLAGAFWSGAGVTNQGLALATADDDDRANYLGLQTAVQTIALAISPLAGSLMLGWLRPMMSSENAFKWLFACIIIWRLLALLALMRVEEKGARTAMSALSELLRLRPAGLKAMKALGAGGDALAREQAIAQVGQSGFAMASGELVRALGDPSPRIRREAARSLGRIGSPDAAAGLIGFVDEHPDLVEEEMLEALGETRRPEALTCLLRFLEDPRSVLRRSAARALGRLNDPLAVQALVRAAGEADDPDLVRSSLQALRMLGAAEAEPAISLALSHPHPGVRVAAAEAVSELGLRSQAPLLRKALQTGGDEAAAEMAYALGSLGEEEDLQLILRQTELLASPTLKRRALMGAAALLGLEAPFYRLLSEEGMGLDARLLATIKGKPAAKRLQVAIDRAADGDTERAIRALLSVRPSAAGQALSECSAPEAFLLAFLLTTREETA